MKNSNTILATTKATILVIAFSIMTSVSLKAQVYSANGSQEDFNEIALNESFVEAGESTKAVELTTFPTFTLDGKYANISQYISDNLQFPENAIITGTSGLLKMRIKILSDGSLGETTVIASPGTDFNTAVLELIEEMPNWNPATAGNKPVDSVYTLQLNFRLQ
ncbi:MAG: energy transducer TonB [Cryomorphaceae bacterium]|nr:energy transducer TonB [Flavobacteriales bacterium]